MSLQEVDNGLLEVVKHADLLCMEKVGHSQATQETGNGSKHVDSSVNML